MHARVLGVVTAIALGATTSAGCYKARVAPEDQFDAGQAKCPAPETGARQGWRHSTRSAAVATLVGSAHHAASDPVINPGQRATVRGKFAYGKLSKDLEDEVVEVWLRMRPCGPWKQVARGLTNSDGRATIDIPAAHLSAPGRYPYQLIVRGDLTRANGTVFVVPRGTKVALFDIDGTLTTGDVELVKQLAYGKDPKPRGGTVRIAKAYAKAGYLPLFVTGRAYMLRGDTRAWLMRHGYPPGILLTTQSLSQARPGRDHVGAFKRDSLRRLAAGPGVDIRYAFGNAMSDVCAYAEAGIDPKRTFIFGKNAGRACDRGAPTQRVGDVDAHILAIVPASQ